MKTFLLVVTILAGGGQAQQALLVPNTPELNTQSGCEMMSRSVKEKIGKYNDKLVVLASCIAVTNDDILKVQIPSDND